MLVAESRMVMGKAHVFHVGSLSLQFILLLKFFDALTQLTFLFVFFMEFPAADKRLLLNLHVPLLHNKTNFHLYPARELLDWQECHSLHA